MSLLPLQQTDNKDLSILQTKWKSILDPVLSNPLIAPVILPGVVLYSGTNVVNHRLGKKLTGWIVIGNSASTTFYDKQASNQQPQLTLVLNASGDCTVSLLVF